MAKNYKIIANISTSESEDLELQDLDFGFDIFGLDYDDLKNLKNKQHTGDKKVNIMPVNLMFKADYTLKIVNHFTRALIPDALKDISINVTVTKNDKKMMIIKLSDCDLQTKTIHDSGQNAGFITASFIYNYIKVISYASDKQKYSFQKENVNYVN